MRRIISVFIFSCISFCTLSQIKVYPADSGQFSIENLARYFVGRGVEISNVTFTGNIQSIGQFSDAKGLIGLKKGIILSTGRAKDAEGPNNQSNVMTSWGTSPEMRDYDLDSIVENDVTLGFGYIAQTSDKAVLEFDFVPLTDTIRFKAVYASEKYDELIGSNVLLDDPFAVFLSIVGSRIKKNIAVFPGENGIERVSIRHINGGPEDTWGVRPSGTNSVNEDFYNFNTKFSPIMQYDGYTKPLSFSAPVNKCTKYHLKIAIADTKVGDISDSGVFLEPGDFGEKAIVSSIPKSFSDTIFACKGDVLPMLTVDGSNTTNLRWYFNDSITGVTSASFPATISGEYKVKATVSGTCFWYDSVNVKIGTKFPLNLTASKQFICNNQLVTFTGFVPSTLTGLHIDWYSATAFPFVDNALMQVLSITSPISEIYLSIRDQSGCVQTDTASVTVNGVFFELSQALVPDSVVCKGNPYNVGAKVKLTNIQHLAVDLFSLRWKNSENEILQTDSITATYLTTFPQKDEFYTVNFASTNGCLDSLKFKVNVDSVLFNKPLDRSICQNESTVLSTSGFNIKSYEWKVKNQFFPISTQNSVIVSPSTTTTYILTIKSDAPNSCTAKDTIVANVNPLPNYTKSSDTTVCRGVPIPIFVRNVDRVIWQNGSVSGSTFNYKANSEEYLVFTALTPFNCSKKDSMAIHLFPNYTNTVVGLNSICLGEVVTLTAINSNTNLWLNTNLSSDKIISKPLTSTIYTFVGSDINNCKDTTKFQVTVNKVQVADPQFIKAIHSGHLCPKIYMSDTLYGPLDFSYSWFRNDTLIANNLQFIEVDEIGLYKLLIKDSNNCELSDSLRVINQCDTVVYEYQFIVPNIFTPNNDPFNNEFEIKNLPANCPIEIYNRWGTIVYKSDSYDNKWDGNNCPDGLYYYKVQILGRNYTGWVQISR